MSEQILKNKLGNKIGSIKTHTDGKQELKSKLGNKLGIFDPKTNKTYNKLGNTIGSGNLLSTLLVDF